MTKRYIANITVEADTTLKVGSGRSDFLQDSPVQRDWNSLPMILGTSIAGVLRKEFDEKLADDIFGKDQGSRVIVSNALLVGEDGKVKENLLSKKSEFLKLFDILPIREHTAITDKGVAKDKSKFDEEVVFKGTRFKFRLELMGDEDDQKSWQKLLDTLSSPAFRIGSGGTKGFGKLKVLEIKEAVFSETDDEYINLSSSLNENFGKEYSPSSKLEGYRRYKLLLKPDDFFMFGSGFGDDDADMTPVLEFVIDYDKKDFKEQKVLIPASSIKGAIAHRTTYHYNCIKGWYIEDKTAVESVPAIFGEKADNDGDENTGSKGKVLFSDLFLKEADTKVFDHVAIDRFTGGGIDGALFQEKTVATDESFEMEFLVEDGVEEDALKAFEKTLDDICNGMLPLGGATTKGHGVFSGEWRLS